MTLLLGIVACTLALTMAVISSVALYRAEHSGRNSRQYVLPVFVGVAYVVLRSLEIHDAAVSGEEHRVVEVAGQFIETAMILSVILLLHRGTHRRD